VRALAGFSGCNSVGLVVDNCHFPALFKPQIDLTANHKVATPAQWKPGGDVIIAGSVNDEQAREIFGEWESPKPYIRIVPQPRGT